MISNHCLSGASLAFVLLAASPVYSDEAATPSAFTYTDDWSLVSAPPPPGPYSAIHIDPRVPGQDSLPPLPGGNQPPQSWEEVQEITASTPPAAGIPAVVTRDKPLQQMRPPQTRPRIRMQPPQPAYNYNYPTPGYYTGRTDYPGHGNRPPAGYYGAPYQQQADEVPPPPVYDALMRRQGVAR